MNPTAYLRPHGVEFLTLDGTLQTPLYDECKAVCFVSESGSQPDLFIEHTVFERRPKVAGLWTRFYLRDGDQLDGILSHNLLEWPGPGYVLVPPRSGASRQRVFVPRAALMATELLGVVGKIAPSHARRDRLVEVAHDQLTMFER